MKSPIPQSWEVPSVLRERVGASLGRQRTMSAEGHLLVVLHEVPNPDTPAVRAQQLFWRAPDGRWKSTASKGNTVAVLREHQQPFTALAERLEERIERAQCAADYFSVLQEATPALRTSRNALRTLQEAREAVGADREFISVRDAAQELERAFELIQGYAKDGLEFASARNAEQSARNTDRVNHSSHQLNLIAAVFFPITALGSLLGMNMRHGFEEWNAPYAFWVVSALAFAFGYWIRAGLPKPDR